MHLLMISNKWEIRPNFTPITKLNPVWTSPSRVTANMGTAVYSYTDHNEIEKEQEVIVVKKMTKQLKITRKCAIPLTWKFLLIWVSQFSKRTHNTITDTWTEKNVEFYPGRSTQIWRKPQPVKHKANLIKNTLNKI